MTKLLVSPSFYSLNILFRKPLCFPIFQFCTFCDRQVLHFHKTMALEILRCEKTFPFNFADPMAGSLNIHSASGANFTFLQKKFPEWRMISILQEGWIFYCCWNLTRWKNIKLKAKFKKADKFPLALRATMKIMRLEIKKQKITV